MLEAFDMYLARGGKGQLVLLNPATADVEKYQSLIDKREIIVLHDIQDSELVELYSQAHCSIMASSFEGFGLPVLESLACGTQVLCANNSSLVEAGGNVACFFQELTAENICCKLLDFDGIKKENTLDNKLNQRHLAHFTWERCAEKYAETYEKLLYNI